MIPPYPNQPACEVCGRRAQHLWADLKEVDPKPIRDTYGKVTELWQRFAVVARHARCEIHPGHVMRYLLDGTVEIDGDLVTT